MADLDPLTRALRATDSETHPHARVPGPAPEFDQGELSEAVARARAAWQLNESLTAGAGAAEFRPELIQSLRVLADQYYAGAQYQQAIFALERLLELHAENSDADEDYSLRLKLSRSYAEVGDLSRAATEAERAIGILQALAERTAGVEISRSLARAYEWSALIAQRLGELERATVLAAQALVVYRGLGASENAQLARALTNLGVYYAADGRDPAEAIAPSKEAVEKYRELAAAEPHIYSVRLADALTNLGTRFFELGQFSSARRELESAVSLYAVAAADDAQHASLPQRAVALKKLSAVAAQMGDTARALGLAEESIRQFRDLAEGDVGEELALAAALDDLALRYAQDGDRDSALRSAQSAVDVYRRWSVREPSKYQVLLARALARLGGFFAYFQRFDDAIVALEESVATYKLFQPRSGRYHGEYLGVVGDLAGSYLERYRAHGELADLDSAVNLLSDALKRVPRGKTRDERVSVLSNLASALLMRHQISADGEDLDRSIELLSRALAMNDGSDARQAAILSNLAEALLRRSDAGAHDRGTALDLLQRAVSAAPLADEREAYEKRLRALLEERRDD